MSAHVYYLKRLPTGEPEVDQGTVHGFPVSYNPDDEKFYILQPDVAELNDAEVLGRFKGWRNAVQFARTLRRKAERKVDRHDDKAQ